LRLGARLFVADADFFPAKSALSPSALLRINFVEGTRGCEDQIRKLSIFFLHAL
jgi:hypothetical protein